MAHGHDIHQFMSQVTKEMSDEYDRIYARASEDPGTAGDEGEENWATLFREWLPPNYHVATKGRLISAEGVVSPQIDVVVLKPAYPKKLLEKRTWLAGGVAAVFECKTTLTAKHVKDSVGRAKIFKSLFEPVLGTPFDELISPLTYGLLAHSHSWKGENSQPLTNIESAYNKALAGIDHPRELLDAICVADLATWTSSVLCRYQAESAPQISATLEKTFGGKWGPATSFTASSQQTDNQAEDFTPIGALITFVTKRLANRDAAVRDLASYYLKANLGGSGSGKMHFWPADVLSDELRKDVEHGRLENGRLWSEWNMVA